MRRCIRHALEAGDAGHVYDVLFPLALDDVDAVEVDTERAATAQRDFSLLGGLRERLTALLRLRPGREDLSVAEELLADHIDLQVTPLGLVIALCEDGGRLVTGSCLDEQVSHPPDDAHP